MTVLGRKPRSVPDEGGQVIPLRRIEEPLDGVELRFATEDRTSHRSSLFQLASVGRAYAAELSWTAFSACRQAGEISG